MDEIKTSELIKLRRLIKELKSKEGRGTELISLYVPSERQIAEIISVLRNEYSQAGNIKDRTTRHHVQEALTSIIQRLKYFNKAPKNGLIIFAGYVSYGVPGSEKLEIYLIEPPYPIYVYLYRCDSKFHVEILEEAIKIEKKYGLVAIDREEASFALIYGNNIEILETITSGIPGKHRAGGQSARRFERVIENLAHEFYQRIGERIVKYYLKENKVDGILVGGPGPTKQEFLSKEYVPNEIKKNIIGIVDLGYSGEEGIYELLERGKDYLQKVELVKQKREIDNFLKILAENPKLIVIGIKEVLAAIERGILDKILIVEEIDIIKLVYSCLKCGTQNNLLINSFELNQIKTNLKCQVCKSSYVKINEEIVETDNIIDKAFEYKIKVIFLSKNLNESFSIKTNFGGIVGILKWGY